MPGTDTRYVEWELALKTVTVRKAAAPYSLGSSSTITTRVTPAAAFLADI
jgi:hypothetical protein